MEQLYSLATVAKMWDVSVKTLRRLIKKADIEMLRVGGKIKVREADLLKLVDTNDAYSRMDQFL